MNKSFKVKGSKNKLTKCFTEKLVAASGTLYEMEEVLIVRGGILQSGSSNEVSAFLLLTSRKWDITKSFPKNFLQDASS